MNFKILTNLFFIFSLMQEYNALGMQEPSVEAVSSDQEIRDTLKIKEIEAYDHKAWEVIKRFWPRIKVSKLINYTASKHDPETCKYRLHPLLTPSGLRTLVSLAIKTNNFIKVRYPDKLYNIFSLGQSPAWVVEAMKIIDEKNNVQDTHYGFMAFSGSWYLPDGEGVVVREASQAPSQEASQAYHRYLDALCASTKRDCVNIAIEFPRSSKGLRSFEETIRGSCFFNQLELFISKPQFSCPGIVLDFIDENTIENFIKLLANADRFEDRLVMSYSHEIWLSKNPLSFHPSDSAELLREMIRAYVLMK